MFRALSLVLLCTSTLWAQYKTEPAGAPPSEVSSEVAALLQPQGHKILNGSKVWCEIWLRKDLPAGPKANEDAVTMPTIPHGSLLAVIRFPERGSDRRGQTVKPGVYTMRFSYFPQNGDHQGVAPQRDFLLVSAADADKDPNTKPNFDTLVAASQKAMGTPHPGVFSMWKVEPADFKAGFEAMGEHDWVLQAKIGDQAVAIILVGKAEG